MRIRLRCLSVFVCLPLCAPAPAQHTARPASVTAPATPAMTNDDVITLTGAGLGDDIVVAKIKAAPSTSFDTSVNGLKALKAANVPTEVIAVMIDPKATPAPARMPMAGAGPAATATASNPDDPMAPHAPGIYMLAKGPDGQSHMMLLERNQPKEHKAGGFWASSATYGLVKAKGKAVLDGAKAPVQTADSRPVFYLYVPDGSSGSFGGSTYNPKDFAMVKLDIKGDTRTVTTGSYSMWGSSSGTDEKARQGFTSDSVKAGVYRLTPVVDLPPGQYAFEQNTFQYYDFGIATAGS